MYSKIGVFGGDIFWSSCPYEMLDVYKEISKEYEVDAIFFNNDIRINKDFKGWEKYYFDVEKYRKIENIKTVDSWKDFYKLSEDYVFILCSSKLFPKTRFCNIPEEIFKKLIFWDVGGADQLTDVALMHMHTPKVRNIITKGPAWKRYIDRFSPAGSDRVKIGGSPQYDPFFKDYSGENIVLEKSSFFEKYSLKEGPTILVAPTNPGSHSEMIDKNLPYIDRMLDYFYSKNIESNVIIKTYPHDYLYGEKDFSGVYKRKFFKDPGRPQYEFFKEKYPNIKIVESQDHYSALKYSNYLFNIAGSHIAWETYFTDCISFSFNYSNQKYFGKTTYLPNYVVYPDSILNKEPESFETLFQKKCKVEKSKARDFFYSLKFKDNLYNILECFIKKRQIFDGK